MACGGTDDVPPVPLDGEGPFSVGRVQIAVDVDGRALPTEIWYPATRTDTTTRSLVAFGIGDAQQALLSGWLADAPSDCVRGEAVDNEAIEPAAGQHPLVVLSHCHECVRFGPARIAERLASHGFIVAAPDHVGATAFEAEDGTSTGFNVDTLQRRVDDVEGTLDALQGLGEGGSVGGVALGGHVETSRVGLLGHSFGAATVAGVAQGVPEVAGIVTLAGPVDPLGLYPADQLAVSILSLRSLEDNTIGTFGNDLIENQLAEATGPRWSIDVRDAGHYSYLDICGLDARFGTGCGEDQRQTNPDEFFEYASPSRVRNLTAAYAVGFFSWVLRDDPAGRELLERQVDELAMTPVFTPASRD